MNPCTMRAAALAALICLYGIAPSRAQTVDTGDTIDTSDEVLVEPNDHDVKGDNEEADNPTERLKAEREAWGMVTPQSRSSILAAARKHNNIKNVRGPKWISVGPTGGRYIQNGSFTGFATDSGRARTILPHPVYADVVYVLTSGGGLWRTNNWQSANPTWKVLTDDLPTTGGGAVAFGRDPNVLYLGLGDPYDQILVGGAVAVSKNGGNTWGPVIELGSAISVRDLKVDTSGLVDTVLVATDSGLYRSADGGLSFAPVSTFNGLSVWSIARTSAGWLASAQPCGPGGLQCGGASTLYLSTDLGATWAPISNAGNVYSNAGRTTLGVGAPGDAVVYAYASTVGDAQMRDVFRSNDGGQTWQAYGVNASKAPTNPNPSMPNMNICQSQCWYNQMVLVDPRDPSRNTVWIGGNLASARTVDGGTTWTLKSWWLPGQFPLPYAHADFHAAAFKGTGTPTIILGNDGGLAETTDNGATFSTAKNNGLVSHLFYSVTGTDKQPGVVLGGLQDNGTRLRLDTSGNFEQVLGGDGMGAAYSVDNTNTVLGSSQGSGMRTNQSNNPPAVFQNWSSATSGISDVGFGFFTSITPAPANLDPTGRVFFHFSNARVWRSNNGGLSWTRIGSAIAPTSPGLPPNRRFRSGISNLGVSPSDLNRIAVGAGGGFIDVTVNGGASWNDINMIAAVPGFQGFITNVTWQDNRNVWVTSVAQLAGSVRVAKVTLGTDGSFQSAVALQNGLPDVPVTRVYFDPRDSSRNTIYAATHVGIYSTSDGGANWAPYGIGLPTVRVNDIYMPRDGGYIRIATYGRGIWELPQFEFVRASLTDGGTSCDRDGVLDNGETGVLRVALANLGPNTINQAQLKVSSSNPHVTFPQGATVQFPPMQKNGITEGTIAVALQGAVGIETTDLQISVSAAELGQSTPVAFGSTYRVNYDQRAASSTTETAVSGAGWTVSGDPVTSPNVLPWQRRALSPTATVWWGPDNNGQSDGVRPDAPDQQILTSPPLAVGADPLVISFQHRYSFENGGWDGGVVELSSDGGSTWSSIGNAAYNGVLNSVTSSPIGAGRPAFVNRSTGWPGLVPVTLNLGTAYAGQTVQIRFRVGADESTGAPGWDIDNINVSGLTNTPFTSLQPETAVCGAP